jgi:putative drug exporter of the RND superfamily
VFIDATIIRMALVPSLMALLGHKAWWIPHWLDRILPRIGITEDDAAVRPPAPVARPAARTGT